MRMTTLSLPDILAFAWFLGAWLIYSIVIEKTAKGRSGLNALMHGYRDDWMKRLLARDMRMVDAQVTAALQNGTAFFASTSLIAIGGALTLMRASEDILPVMYFLGLGSAPSRQLWELKMLGLIVIFVYAFFKFAWSYRLFNYFAIMVGAARRKRTRLKLRPSPIGLRISAPMPDGISIAASAPSFSRSAISAGSWARCRWF